MVYITTLVPGPYQFKRDIPISVEAVENGYVASFVDANINASGETVNDAVANLKDMFVTLFEHLENVPDGKLGKSPRVQLAVLREVMVRGERNGENHQTTRKQDRQEAKGRRGKEKKSSA